MRYFVFVFVLLSACAASSQADWPESQSTQPHDAFVDHYARAMIVATGAQNCVTAHGADPRYGRLNTRLRNIGEEAAYRGRTEELERARDRRVEMMARIRMEGSCARGTDAAMEAFANALDRTEQAMPPPAEVTMDFVTAYGRTLRQRSVAESCAYGEDRPEPLTSLNRRFDRITEDARRQGLGSQIDDAGRSHAHWLTVSRFGCFSDADTIYAGYSVWLDRLEEMLR